MLSILDDNMSLLFIVSWFLQARGLCFVLSPPIATVGC